MRINKYIALATGISRRAADDAVYRNRVLVNGELPSAGYDVLDADSVTMDNQLLKLKKTTTTIMMNKPIGYVCSRDGQGNQTVYDLMPSSLHHLKPVGRLDMYSSGLLLFTDDGNLAQKLTHPSFGKNKVYKIELDKKLYNSHMIDIQKGIRLEDGLSALQLAGKDYSWTVTMHEGRNRQIRRTFSAFGYHVTKLTRTEFGNYKLGTLPAGKYSQIVV